MFDTQEIQAKLVISGTFEFRDAAGNLVKTIELSAEVPPELKEPEHGNQRSE